MSIVSHTYVVRSKVSIFNRKNPQHVKKMIYMCNFQVELYPRKLKKSFLRKLSSDSIYQYVSDIQRFQWSRKAFKPALNGKMYSKHASNFYKIIKGGTLFS